MYSVSVDYYPGNDEALATAADTFRIGATGCIVDCEYSTWGHIKSLYR
jgi:hypothetical protein